MKHSIALLFSAAALLACSDSSAPEDRAILRVTNLRSDTVATVRIGDCASADLGGDRLQPRDQIATSEHRDFEVGTTCFDLEVSNPRDSVLDMRTSVTLEPGDTFAVTLRQ